MGKFYGTIGFVKTEESSPGVWQPVTEEYGYCGDLIRNIERNDSGNKVNRDVSLNNQVSVICNRYAQENLQFIKYVRFLGTAWTVTSVEINYPRLVLNLGGVYSEEVEEDDEESSGITG